MALLVEEEEEEVEEERLIPLNDKLRQNQKQKYQVKSNSLSRCTSRTMNTSSVDQKLTQFSLKEVP